MLYQNLIIGLIANLVELEIVNFLESYVHLLNSVISMVILDIYSYGDGKRCNALRFLSFNRHICHHIWIRYEITTTVPVWYYNHHTRCEITTTLFAIILPPDVKWNVQNCPSPLLFSKPNYRDITFYSICFFFYQISTCKIFSPSAI